MPAAYWKARVHHHPAIVLRAAARRTLGARQSRTLLDERTPVRHAGMMTNLQKLKSELERAQGRFYDFHQMMGRVDFPMGDPATMLRDTGQPQAAPTRQPPSMSSTRLIRPKTRQEPTHNVRSTISASVNCSCISIQRSSPMARWSDANRVA